MICDPSVISIKSPAVTISTPSTKSSFLRSNISTDILQAYRFAPPSTIICRYSRTVGTLSFFHLILHQCGGESGHSRDNAQKIEEYPRSREHPSYSSSCWIGDRRNFQMIDAGFIDQIHAPESEEDGDFNTVAERCPTHHQSRISHIRLPFEQINAILRGSSAIINTPYLCLIPPDVSTVD